MDDWISTKGKQSRETGGKFVFLLFAGVVRFPISKLDKEIYARNIISHAVWTYWEISYDNRMAKEYTLKAISSLFEEKLSERSCLLNDVKAADSILREFETTTTTRDSCFKASKGFGNTGKGLPILFMIACNRWCGKSRRPCASWI